MLTSEREAAIRKWCTNKHCGSISTRAGNELLSEIDALRAQRAELLSACEEMLDGLDEYWVTTELGSDIVSRANAAIAKAEGKVKP